MSSGPVDHEQRRRQVAEAVWRVVRRDGLQGATMRRVAQDAGVSIGLVQHYFSTKEELENFAFDRVLAMAQERMAEKMRELGAVDSTRALVRLILLESTVPADPQRLAEYQVVLSFSLRALQREDMAKELRAGADALNDLIVERLADAQRSGEARSNLTPEVQASMLLSYAEGCGQRVLLGYTTTEQAVQALDALLDLIFEDDATRERDG